jgi:hypothetical protein
MAQRPHWQTTPALARQLAWVSQGTVVNRGGPDGPRFTVRLVRLGGPPPTCPREAQAESASCIPAMHHGVMHQAPARTTKVDAWPPSLVSTRTLIRTSPDPHTHARARSHAHRSMPDAP